MPKAPIIATFGKDKHSPSRDISKEASPNDECNKTEEIKDPDCVTPVIKE